MKRRLLLAAALLSVTTTAIPAAAVSTTAASTAAVSTDPVPALTQAAHPLLSTTADGQLRDLRPLTRDVGAATVVGVGEATHNSSEFFTLKHRIFRALVEQKGFTTFALEASWSTGVSLDRYVVTGIGDPREIMRREFQGSYRFWNVREYLDLIEWMRDYNRTHARKLRFVGDDLGYVGPDTITQVTDYIRKTRPALLPEINRLYAGLPPETEVAQWSATYWAKPRADRLAVEAATRQAVVRVESLPAGPGKSWAVQNARSGRSRSSSHSMSRTRRCCPRRCASATR